MSSNPLQSNLQPSIAELTARGREPNASLDTGHRQHTLLTEHQETSNNDIQSLVIVKDINVEEELIKAQKDDKNYFKALSMSFYGKGKSRSVDSQDLKVQVGSPQHELQPGLFKKLSSQTPSDTKRHSFHRPKNKSQGQIKKSGVIMKEFYMIPEQFRKRFLSPRDDLRKMCTPIMLGRKERDEFIMKTKPDKEAPSYISSHQRIQTTNVQKNRDGSPDIEENKIMLASYLKTMSGNRSNSPKKKSPKKKSINTMPKKANMVPLEVGERMATFNIVPSLLEMELQKLEETSKKKSRNPSPEVTGKKGKSTRKQSPKQEPGKSTKNKSISTPTKSMKSLPSTANSQLKISRSESQEVKKPVILEAELKTLLGDGILGQGTETRSSDKSPYKTRSQDFKKTMNTEEKIKHVSLLDFQDSDTEDGVVRLETLPMQEKLNKKSKKSSSEKLEKQRSPLGVKLCERVSTMLGSGMGNWEMKDITIARKDINLKMRNKDSGQESVSPDIKYKSKPNSVEKLSRADISEHWEDFRGEEASRKKKQLQTPKLDAFKPKDERALKIFEVYGQPKEKKDKSRPVSPALGEFQKTFSLFGKLASKTRKEKL